VSTPGGGWVPVPDPTTLTTEQLRRELNGLREILEARLDSMDHENELMRQLIDERRDEIAQRFAERDIRFNERDESRQSALRLALDSARELVNQRDEATTKASEKFEQSVRLQITQLEQLSSANRDVLDGRINDLKERIDRGEGSTAGVAQQRGELRLDRGVGINSAVAIIMSVSVIISIISVILVVVLHK